MRTTEEIIHEALKEIQPHERVLAIISDKTRDDNTDQLFPIVNRFLTELGVAKFDAVPVISRGQVAVKIHSRHQE